MSQILIPHNYFRTNFNSEKTRLKLKDDADGVKCP